MAATIWKVTNLYVERLTSSSVIAWWKFSTGSTTARFDVFWEWWSTQTKAWVLAQGSAKSVPVSSQEGGWFQDTWNPPSDETATKVRICVNPIPTSGAKWKHGWKYSEWCFNPYYEDLIGDALDAPDAEAGWADGAQAVEVSWGEANEQWDRVTVWRSADGGDMALLAKVGPEGPYLDASISPGRTYRYAVQPGLDGSEDCETSAPTEAVKAEPVAPTSLSAACASPSSVRLDWQDSGTTGDSYVIEWSTDPDAWDEHADPDGTDEYVGQPDASGRNHRTVGGLGDYQGMTLWFRMRRRESGNPDGRELSAWATSGSALQVPCVVGSVPDAPTLGFSPSSAPIDEPLALSWTHNSEDGSSQTAYEVEVTAGGSTTPLSGTTASSVTVTPSDYVSADGSALSWRVRTKGAVSSWSPWSATGTATVWARPVAGVTVAQRVDSLPLSIALSADGSSAGNLPTRYWLGVYAAEGHRATLADGTEGWVAEGECAWYGEASPGDEGCDASGWQLSLGAADVRLDAGCAYTVEGGCVTAQGMACDAEPATFMCALGGEVDGCDAEVEMDADGLFAVIRPTCTDGPDGTVRDGVTLSVWRVDPDGTELVAAGLAPDGSVPCVDLHPQLGLATYRVVATDVTTGAQGAADLAVEWACPGIVIQWDESLAEAPDGTLALSARRVVLPYNVRTSRQVRKESSLRRWDGHRYPVSRYGDHVEDTATWSIDIERLDRAQYDALVELGGLMGDVHVRDPWGASYWALVDVDGLDARYDSAAVGVTLSVTRVEA